MLKLKNVSKFYYSNGVIASGFSRVNLELNMGEFVVITGESGSGKSTLLNVLSGLDTYEEGEMYINGQETSHYNEADFEKYRRTYVGNIFQNFNLVNSYTVYQNVELALILNGENKKAVKEKVLNIIEKVGLSDFANTKCSKLSGGQKQRVAIARALAKDTPIIVADEPTGNLDSKSAREVMKTLSEISKDKLVIIVTHNLEQVEEYATRLIKMHDGKILEDKVLEKPEHADEDKHHSFADITVTNRLRLGVRNAFNIPTKFILIFSVFLFISFAVGGTYSSFQKMIYDESIYGYNSYFSDTSDSRIIINKADKSPITEEEFDSIESLGNIKKIAKNDMLVDYTQGISDKNYEFYFYGTFEDLYEFDGELTAGRMPENPYEIIVEGLPYDYNLVNNQDEILATDFYLEKYDLEGNLVTDTPIKVVGIYLNENKNSSGNVYYAGAEIMNELQQNINENKSQVVSLFKGEYYTSNSYDSYFHIMPSDAVPSGEAYVSKKFNDLTTNGNCVGKSIVVKQSNIYNEDSLTVKISKTYNKSNFKSLLEKEYKESEDGIVYINSADYNNLMNKGVFQSSVYVKDVKSLDKTVDELKALGFNTLVMRDSLNSANEEIMQLLSLIRTFVLGSLIVALFFISYFVIRIILKSRNSYYTTLRTLGASRKISKQLLDIELILIATLSYATFMAVMMLVYTGTITQGYVVDLAGYLNTNNYIVMYLIIIAMSYMISNRFSKKLFKDSVMNTYREEV